jgi:hypothetical protein
VTLRGKVVLRAVGFTLAGVAILGFAFRVISKVMDGHGLDSYQSGKLVQWNYSAAFVTLVVLAGAALIAGAIRFTAWFRERREFSRLPQVSAKSGSDQV